MTSDRAIDQIAAALYGLKPYDPNMNTPTDVGLGGPSTEYLAGSQDPYGNELTYPQIWWMGNEPYHLSPDDAYNQAMQYESATGKMFPRYVNAGASDFAAQNRSAMGGAEFSPLANLWPWSNF